MYARTFHAFLKDITVLRQVAELSFEHTIEIIHMLFRPFHTGGHHDHWEAGLIYQSRVFDDGEVNEGHLINVKMKIALEDALPGNYVNTQLLFIRKNHTYLTRFLIISLLASR